MHMSPPSSNISDVSVECLGHHGNSAKISAGVYYNNIWEAKSMPFLSQELFNLTASNSTYFSVYNQSLILNDKFEIDFDALDIQGVP